MRNDGAKLRRTNRVIDRENAGCIANLTTSVWLSAQSYMEKLGKVYHYNHLCICYIRKYFLQSE